MRFLFLPPLLFIALALLFEGAFFFLKKQLTAQQRGVSTERSAIDFKLNLFEGDKVKWTLWGKKGDFSQKGYIEVSSLKGENKENHLVVSSEKALFDEAKRLIYLKGNVVVLYGNNGQRVRIETDAATVDLRKGVIYGKGKVVIREPGRVLVGKGFRYYIDSGKFIILRDVQSFIVSP